MIRQYLVVLKTWPDAEHSSATSRHGYRTSSGIDGERNRRGTGARVAFLVTSRLD